jgi:hypothetical protein
MKFFLAATFFTAVLATPLVSLVERQDGETETIIDLGPALPPPSDGNNDPIATGETPTTKVKRNTRSELVKRAITVDIWQDQNRGGRHEALVTDSMTSTSSDDRVRC